MLDRGAGRPLLAAVGGDQVVSLAQRGEQLRQDGGIVAERVGEEDVVAGGVLDADQAGHVVMHGFGEEHRGCIRRDGDQGFQLQRRLGRHAVHDQDEVEIGDEAGEPGGEALERRGVRRLVANDADDGERGKRRGHAAIAQSCARRNVRTS